MADNGCIVGHLSDTHVVARGDALFGVDTVGHAEAAVAHIRALAAPPDVVVITGDVTAHGAPEEYAVARELFDQLGLPYFVLPGNHDRRQAMVDAFGDHAPRGEDGSVQGVLWDGEVRVIGLDTLDESEPAGGRLTPRRLEWLAATLSRAPETPTMVCLHHPPVRTGIGWMDDPFLAGAPDLGAILARNPQVGLVACGHIHRTIGGMIGHARVAVAPSTAFEVHLDLATHPEPGVVMDPGAYALHRFHAGQWITHMAKLDGLKPIPI